MRTVTDHIVEGDSANHQLTISVTDVSGQGGACHRYERGRLAAVPGNAWCRRATQLIMTRAETAKRQIQKDKRVRGVSMPIRLPDGARRGPARVATAISGKRTTLADLIDRAMERSDARRKQK